MTTSSMAFAKKLAAKVCRPNQTSHLPLESSWLIDSLENEARQVQIGRVPKVSQKSQWRENVFLSQLWQRSCMIIPQENYGIDHQLSRSNMAKPNLSPSIADRERERESVALSPPSSIQSSRLGSQEAGEALRKVRPFICSLGGTKMVGTPW